MRVCSSIFIHSIYHWTICECCRRLVSYPLGDVLKVSVFHSLGFCIHRFHILRISNQDRAIKHFSCRYIPSPEHSHHNWAIWFVNWIILVHKWIIMRILRSFSEISSSPQKVIIAGVINVKAFLFIFVNCFWIRCSCPVEQL